RGGGALVVGDEDHKGLVVMLARGKRLHGAGGAVRAVVQRIGPRAGSGIDAERTVGAVGAALDRVGLGRAMINVGGLHLTGGDQGGVFRHRAGLRAGADHRSVVLSLHDALPILRGGGALVVGDEDRKGLVVMLARGK